MKKKKLLSILLSAALAFSLTACGNSNTVSYTHLISIKKYSFP